MREPRSSFQELSKEEGNVKPATHGQGDGGEGKGPPKQTPAKKSPGKSEYSYTYETDEDDDTKEDEKGDKQTPKEEETKDSLDEFYKNREFLFVHHFAGVNDPLSKAMAKEAEAQGIQLRIVSVEKDAGSGDLLASEPYSTHLLWAKRGLIDAYHAGFPCSTFSRLRFRESVRSKDEPYGMKDNTTRQQEEADRGTIMAARSIDMAVTTARHNPNISVQAIATLENPPESDTPGHLSAWELPEMDKFFGVKGRHTAVFHTCKYEEDLPIGKRHYKPQVFTGTLAGLQTLSATCECGSRSNHEVIVGSERSRASAEYPKVFCEKYAALAIKQLKMKGKEEYLKDRLETLKRIIETRKLILAHQKDMKDWNKEDNPKLVATKEDTEFETKHLKPKKVERPPLPRKRRYEDMERDPPMSNAASSSRRQRSRSEERGVRLKSASRKRSRSRRRNPESRASEWKGGEGHHGALRTRAKKEDDPSKLGFLGGMRHPRRAIVARSTILSAGLRVRAAWEALLRQDPTMTSIAETYGTLDCTIDENKVQKWAAILRKTLGAQAKPKVRMKGKYHYTSPLDPQLIAAWVRRSGDPDVHVPQWVEEGAPLGIELPIPTAGIFPSSDEQTQLDHMEQVELSDASSQLSKGHMLNYTSVLENEEQAKIELDRYRQAGFMKDVPEAEVKSTYKKGTISKLGLIIKERPEGTKRRIILQLRRSQGNDKAVLPERLVLPRPIDAIDMIREAYQCRQHPGSHEGYARELAVVDISDAFMALGVHPKEQGHTLAPEVGGKDFYMFVALLFGYKTAPLLWSRTASLLARMLQAFFQVHEAVHQVYLDDSLWLLQGTLAQRNSHLSLILMTMLALGFKVSVKKGERAEQVQWIGVKFTLTTDYILMGIPEKYTRELIDLLKSWDRAGMASTKQLRQAAGKISWLSGILPKTRWIVSVFYRVLHDRTEDVASGTEEHRRQSRKDSRNKDHLFPVKQLDQARQWLIHFLETAMLKPVRKLRLDISKYPKATITTDASPLGVGALLLVNNRVIRALASPITKEEAELLGYGDVHGESGSQGIAELLAVLVALKHWTPELTNCAVSLTVQSDSMIALAATQRLSHSTPALNFLSAEVALTCEKIGIESLKTTHVPGSANIEADYLSRPDKWTAGSLPTELEGVPIAKDLPKRDESYFVLPPPSKEPGLWASSAVANSIWPNLN